MHTLKTLYFLFVRIFATVSLRSWKVAILCGGLASMGHHRKRMRSQLIAVLDKSTNGGNIQMRFKVRGKLRWPRFLDHCPVKISDGCRGLVVCYRGQNMKFCRKF
jgi:hypothetical protein